MKRLLILLALMVPAIGAARADTPQELFEQGNRAYMDGQYRAAAQTYLKVDVENPHLYHNTGLAWLKAGDVGQAVYYLNRAHRLTPRDNGITAALAAARKQRVDELPPAVQPLPFTVGEAACAAAFFLSIVISTLIARRLPGAAPYARRVGWVAVLLFLITAGGAAAQYYRLNLTRTVVVTARQVQAHRGPGAAEEKAFVLHAGAEAIATDREDGFTRITLPTGWAGWVREEAVRPLPPAGL